MTEFNATTTLNEIRSCSPCDDGWKKLLAHLGKTRADDEPLHLSVILDATDFNFAAWCLRAPSLERLSRHFQAWCAEQVLPPYDPEFPSGWLMRALIKTLRDDNATEAQRAAAYDEACIADRSNASDTAMDALQDAASYASVEAREAQKIQLRRMIGMEVE